MSGTGDSRQDFAGEERAFRIRLGEIRHIEAKCDCGIGLVLGRLSRAVLLVSQAGGLQAFAAGLDIRADDVRTTLYEGLVGAGMPSPEATKIVREEIDERGVRGIVDNIAVALAVLWASQEAPRSDEDAGEEVAAETPPPEPTSPSSTASEASSA